MLSYLSGIQNAEPRLIDSIYLSLGTTEPSLLPIETVTTSDTHVISNGR